MTAPIIIFAGPSLPLAARPSAPEIAWRPPVRQGDVERAAREAPRAIGIIDGAFEDTPTVWHKEILAAMARGIAVYGAASIGALRAAELDTFGMIGVGEIYEQFRDGVLQDDDEVAMLHGPAETGYVPLTEAMVNVRATVLAARDAGLIGGEGAKLLVGAAKSLFFKHRSYDRICVLARERMPSASPVVADFQAWLRTGRIDRKRGDAQAMTRAVLADSRSKPSEGVGLRPSNESGTAGPRGNWT